MARRIDRRPEARRDLLEIWHYIAADNPAAADRVLDGIEASLIHLAECPELGRARPEIQSNLRSIVAGNYLVFYMPRTEAIEVIRVIRAERDISPDMFSRSTEK